MDTISYSSNMYNILQYYPNTNNTNNKPELISSHVWRSSTCMYKCCRRLCSMCWSLPTAPFGCNICGVQPLDPIYLLDMPKFGSFIHPVFAYFDETNLEEFEKLKEFSIASNSLDKFLANSNPNTNI